MSSVSGINAPAGFRFSLQQRHRLWLVLAALTSAALLIALTINGAHYYVLPLAQRVKSPQHALLRPSGAIGRSLGIFALFLFGIMFLYPLRKRLRFLSGWGTTKNWLDYHIVIGVTAPVLVAFHASFKMNGIAGAAFWIMIAVALSGIVGRYLYSAIPRRLDEAEMSMDEMQQLSRELAAQLEGQQTIAASELRPLLDLPALESVQAMSTWRALIVLLRLDLRRALVLTKLRLHSRSRSRNHSELARVLALAKQQAALSKNILFLSKMRQLFKLWHVIHRPFSYSFAALALLHVVVVTVLGFFWA